MWPGITALCKSKELPAKTLFLLLQHSELILKFVSSSEFCQVMMPLISKSLDCGVPKLQILALEQIALLFKSLEYQYFKTNTIPRILKILEETTNLQVRVKVL